MEEKTVNIYGETYTMHLVLPVYVLQCTKKQLRKVLKEMYRNAYDWSKLESDLLDMLEAVKWAQGVALTKTAKTRTREKKVLIVDAINNWTERIVDYDD